MSAIGWPRILWNRAVGFGKTRALAEATRSINGILVCITAREATRVSNEHKVQTFALSRNMDSLLGSQQPIIFEPESVAAICDGYDRAIEVRDRVIRAAKLVWLQEHGIRKSWAALYTRCKRCERCFATSGNWLVQPDEWCPSCQLEVELKTMGEIK